jgi:hypothetical protein
MFRFCIELEKKNFDGGIWRGGMNAWLNYSDGVLYLSMENVLEKCQKLSIEDTRKMLKSMGLEDKSSEEMENVFMKIFTEEAIKRDGSEKIFLDICKKHDVVPKYDAYFY